MNKQDAKALLQIPEIWSRFNLPGKPQKLCSSPFREDKHPSFSVSADGALWNDFATGEGGDQIDFFARAAGVTPLFKVQKFIELAVSIFGDTDTAPDQSTALKSALATFRAPSEEECRQIGASRGLTAIGPFIAGQIGTLLIGQVGGFDCWVLTDEKRRLAEARRMDGLPFPAFGSLGERKAHTLKGSKKDWPVGILPRLKNHQSIQKILLVEGGPDYLAALQLSVVAGGDALAVAILGAHAGRRIHPEALKLFEGRRVRILEHGDQSGQQGASEWFEELKEVCTVDRSSVGSIDERAHDLNDFVRLAPEKLQLQMFQILLP